MRFLVLLSLFFSLVFGAYEKELSNFDKNFLSLNNDAQIKMHNQLKSYYVQSVIKEDEKTKLEILKRLIISSNVLNLDDKSYVEELKEDGLSQKNIDDLKKIALKNIPQIKQNSEKSQNTKTIYLLNSKKNDKGISLNFNTSLKKSDFKNFVLDEKNNYRFISDFDAVLEGGRKEYNFDDFNIVLSQYNPKTIRLVIRAKDKIDIDFDFNEKNINILVNSKKNNENKNKTSLKNTDIQKKLNIKDAPKNQNSKKLYVLNITKSSNGINLKFNDDLDKKNISSIAAKEQKVFRRILSFEGVLEGNRKTFSFGSNFITITQYNPKIVRIVASAPKEFALDMDFDDKSLNLSFQNMKEQDSLKQRQETKKNLQANNENKDTLSTSFKSGKIIVIDAGHGGKDSGALSDKRGSLKEKDIVLSTALKLGGELKKRGYKVFYTRSSDKFINLRARTKFANDKKADLFISIHANAVPSSKARTSEGVETFFLSPARSERSKEAAEKENQGDFEEINYFSKQSILNFLNREKIVASNKLAIDMQKGVLNQTRKKYKVVDGGVREAPFWVLVGALMPAILIEIGYITHPSEGKRIANKNFQDLLAKGIADGIDNYFYNNR